MHSKKLDAKVKLWHHNSQGLFDYSAKDFQEYTLKWRGDAFLTKSNNRIQNQPSLPKTPIAKLKANDLALYPGHLFASLYQDLWLVARSFTNGYRLAPGDIIRLGAQAFKVKQICTDKPTNKGFSLTDLLVFQEPSEETSQVHSLPCRVCLSESYSSLNPLISPCNCKGSMKYIHLKCLQQSIKSRVHSTDYSLAFMFKNLSCELCSKQYSSKFYLNGELKDLLEIKNLPQPYIVLESLSCKEQGLYIASFCTKSILSLGRSHQSEVLIKDPSVSRNHAKLVYKGQGIYLKDNKSKYGTTILVKRPISLKENSHLEFQSENSTIEFKASGFVNLLPSCLRQPVAREPKSPSLPLFPVNEGICLSTDDLDFLVREAQGELLNTSLNFCQDSIQNFEAVNL